MVTGARVSRAAPRAPAFGKDWTACTVDDPARSLPTCRAMFGSTTPGPTGRAAALVGEGVTQAWRGEVDAAIASFDRAIAIAPRFAPAYLNRGLAHARAGDDARAIADLNQAVRRSPDDAGAYRARSQLLRARGDTRKADADARRAAEIDRR